MSPVHMEGIYQIDKRYYPRNKGPTFAPTILRFLLFAIVVLIDVAKLTIGCMYNQGFT